MQFFLCFLFVVGAAASGGELDDHVSFLQGEVEKQVVHRKASAKAPQYVGGDTENDGDSSCPMPRDGSSSPCDASGTPRGSLPRAQRDGGAAAEPLAAPVPARRATEGTPQERSQKSGTTAFGLFLYVLIVLLVCDGARRWWFDAKLVGDADDWQVCMEAARTDVWGCTMLHAAAKCGAEEVVAKLLEQGCDVEPMDACDDTPLHLAARGGHSGICELLIENGATADAVNGLNLTPLVVAAQEGKEATCKALLGRGAGVAGMQAEDVPALLRALLPSPEESFAEMERAALAREREDFLQELAAEIADM